MQMNLLAPSPTKQFVSICERGIGHNEFSVLPCTAPFKIDYISFVLIK